MPANQLTESQKTQIAEQYRSGGSSVAIGKRFGCSDRTVMRIARSRLSTVEMEALKQQNRKRPKPSQPAPTTPAAAAVSKQQPSVANKPVGGTTGQLSESQKAQIAEQYRSGASSVAIGKRFGCSDRTVMRIARSRLSTVEMEALKRQNRKRPKPSQPAPTTPAAAAVSKKQPSVANKPVGGTTGQLSESQKAQIAEQYRSGGSSVAIGKRFGCSDRTVMRIARSRLSTVEMEALKQQNRKRPKPSQPAPTTPAAAAVSKKQPSVANKPVGGTTGQLSESQKAQIAEQYRSGGSSVAIGKRFGCSDRTVMRIARSRLSAVEMEALKQQNRKRPKPSQPAPTTPAAAVVGDDQPLVVDEPIDSLHGPNSLPWEDAEDFVENDGKDDDGAMEEDDSTLPAVRRQTSNSKEEDQQSTAVVRAAKLDVNRLPSPLYLLVERSVELQPRTLDSLHHLAPLDTGEKQRQGLVLFSSIRQARRQCRRNQRIVKVADPTLLGKTAPHLLAQGISRLVVESNLYALPDSPTAAQL